ncbi:hypothetical protein GCM10022246_24540 [Pedobacter ginsengiterrae]|uniref:OmpA-like domain-containing protein n=1 Tax=Pedobacter ginsengiterrae TaxID=871696 RepID=A0ABP7PU88_9SPHI
MKQLRHLFFLLILLSCQKIQAQRVIITKDAASQARLLKINGENLKVVYFPSSDMYYFCSESPLNKRRRKQNEILQMDECSCAIKGVLDYIALTGFEPIKFGEGLSELPAESYPTLDKLASVLKENSGKVTIAGYSSSEGSAAYNLKLSKDRANSVKTYLVNSGVYPSQVVTKGFGEANPISSNDTEEGRIQNRRVETSRN